MKPFWIRQSVVIILLILIFGIPLNAQIISGNTLVEFMREYEKALTNNPGTMYLAAGNFTGYVTGVYDATCFAYSPPGDVTVQQLCAIVAKHLKEHPEKWSSIAAVLVIDALKAAFAKNNTENRNSLAHNQELNK